MAGSPACHGCVSASPRAATCGGPPPTCPSVGGRFTSSVALPPPSAPSPPPAPSPAAPVLLPYPDGPATRRGRGFARAMRRRPQALALWAGNCANLTQPHQCSVTMQADNKTMRSFFRQTPTKPERPTPIEPTPRATKDRNGCRCVRSSKKEAARLHPNPTIPGMPTPPTTVRPAHPTTTTDPTAPANCLVCTHTRPAFALCVEGSNRCPQRQTCITAA